MVVIWELGSSPVALPRVAHVSVVNAVFVRLLVQEVKHVFDGEGQSAPPMNCAEQCLKEIVNKFLERTLGEEGAQRLEICEPVPVSHVPGAS